MLFEKNLNTDLEEKSQPPTSSNPQFSFVRFPSSNSSDKMQFSEFSDKISNDESKINKPEVQFDLASLNTPDNYSVKDSKKKSDIKAMSFSSKLAWGKDSLNSSNMDNTEHKNGKMSDTEVEDEVLSSSSDDYSSDYLREVEEDITIAEADSSSKTFQTHKPVEILKNQGDIKKREKSEILKNTQLNKNRSTPSKEIDSETEILKRLNVKNISQGNENKKVDSKTPAVVVDNNKNCAASENVSEEIEDEEEWYQLHEPKDMKVKDGG
jgi:hypothetical protein